MLGKALIFIFSVIVIIGAVLFFNQQTKSNTTSPTAVATSQPAYFDFGNQKFTLNNEQLAFTSGSFQKTDPTTGQHLATITNQNISSAQKRAAAILVDNPGGSGTFYYLVGAMVKGGKQTFSTPVLLADRIKIISIRVDDPGQQNNGLITIEYLDHPKSAPLSTEPSKKMTAKYAFQDDGNLIAVLH